MITRAKPEALKDLSPSLYRFVYLALGECIDFSRFVQNFNCTARISQRMTSLYSILLFIGDEFLK